MKKFNMVVHMPLGLHARPANRLIKTALQFKSSIQIIKGDKEADGKRLLSVMALGVKQGDEITVIAEGVDEAEAIHAIRKLFYDNFGE